MIELQGQIPDELRPLLVPEALDFLHQLHVKFEPERQRLLQARTAVQRRVDNGTLPDFLAETRAIREGAWRVAEIPAEIRDRKVEITGPVDRKMVINALNSGARVFMADFEDSHSPTWLGTLEGQQNLRDAVRKTIRYESPEGKRYALNDRTAVLMVRPRGWHLVERHARVDDTPISGSLFDFGLFFFHNAKELLARGTRPYFYLPKMESHLEARLWNEVFVHAQSALGIPRGTIRATVLIETILAAFEMDEILYELKEHSAGLNCGRWDYIFSFIKKFRNLPGYTLPDRSAVTMAAPFLDAYVRKLVETCHRRGIHAMGGMAAQIPIKNDPAANEAAMQKVRADKQREVDAGHDGTWVAHPGLVPIALEVFERGFSGPNQIGKQMARSSPSAQDLLTAPKGDVTDAGFRTNVSIALLYLESWLRGVGCVPLGNLMEDAATAEISRAQIWQWIRNQIRTASGQLVTADSFRKILKEEKIRAEQSAGAGGRLTQLDSAARLLERITVGEEFPEFLTLPAYGLID